MPRLCACKRCGKTFRPKHRPGHRGTGRKDQCFCSHRCANRYRFNSRIPAFTVLAALLEKMPVVKIAKQYGVCHHAVQDWVKQYGLHAKPNGYWQKVNYDRRVSMPPGRDPPSRPVKKKVDPLDTKFAGVRTLL